MIDSKSRMVKPAIGIDLGTTYSCVAVFQNGRPEVIANSQGDRITPSVVAFTRNSRIIGEGAEIQKNLNPENTIYNAKRFIGRTWNDPIVQENASRYPFKVKEKNNKIQFEIQCATKTTNLTPEEISAAVLSRMKNIAEDYLEETVEEAVITVPAYFSDSQRQATKDAGKIAGLNVMRIINEPTAAAMAYGLKEDRKDVEGSGKNVLVYDIGGGTFDVSVLEIEKDLIQIKATGGNTHLGGEDFTTILVKHFKKEIFRKDKIDLTPNHKAVSRLTGACEKLKRNLSAENATQSKIVVHALLPNNTDFVSSMSRAKFESLCQDLFNETITEVDKVLKDAEVTKAEIDEVVLVGGSSRIPKLQSMLSKFFDNKILCKSVNPDEAVACGAAIQAAILNNDQDISVKDMLLLDVNPLPIGVNTVGGVSTVIIERNTILPIKKIYSFTTGRQDGVHSVIFKITEGTRTMTKDNDVLGSFLLSDITPNKDGENNNIDTEFEMDANGILTISATLRGTNKKASIKVDSPSSGQMSTEEINKLVEDAEKMAILDEAEENRVLSMNKLISLCKYIQYVSKDHPNNLLSSLLRNVTDCINWVNEHPQAKEDDLLSRYKKLKTESTGLLKQSEIYKSTKRSSHVLRMSKLKCSYYLKEGRELIKSNKKVDQAIAIEYFFTAYKIANEKGQLVKEIEALSYLGHAHRIMCQTAMIERNTRIYHATHAVRSLTFVLSLDKNKTLSEKDRSTIVQDIQFGTAEFFKIIDDIEDDDKLEVLKKFMCGLDNCSNIQNAEFIQTVFQCHIKEIQIFLQRVESCLAEGNSQIAQNYIKDLYHPTEQARLVARSKNQEEKLNKLTELIHVRNMHSQSLNHMNQAVQLIEGVGIDEPDLIEKALIALDHLTEAKTLAKDLHDKVFIKAEFLEGKIYMDYVIITAKAKACFENVTKLSEQSNFNTEESRQSKYLLEQLKAETEKKDKPNVSTDSLIKECELVIQKLENANKVMNDEDFVNFIFSEFPPKHRKNCEKPEINKNNSKKKAYIRISTFYHPDKVDVSDHGEKYKFFCGEISKCVNGRLSQI